MSVLAILKRVAPFILTFAAGLFIASFFVTIAAPNFNGFKRNPSKYREFKRMKGDIEELRREKSRLKEEIQQLRTERRVIIETVDPFADVDIHEVPAPPPPPRAHDHRFGTGHGTGSGTGSGK